LGPLYIKGVWGAIVAKLWQISLGPTARAKPGARPGAQPVVVVRPR